MEEFGSSREEYGTNRESPASTPSEAMEMNEIPTEGSFFSLSPHKLISVNKLSHSSFISIISSIYLCKKATR